MAEFVSSLLERDADECATRQLSYDGIPPTIPRDTVHETGGGDGAEFWRIVRANQLSPSVVELAINAQKEMSMTRHKHQPEDPMAHLPISQLSPDGQLRRAFPVWIEGSVKDAKCLGDVVRFMIELEREDYGEVQA